MTRSQQIKNNCCTHCVPMLTLMESLVIGRKTSSNGFLLSFFFLATCVPRAGSSVRFTMYVFVRYSVVFSLKAFEGLNN